MSRKLVWIEQQRFQGFTCSECGWRFKPSGRPPGTSFDELMSNFELQQRQSVYIACLRRSPRTQEHKTPVGMQVEIHRGYLSCSPVGKLRWRDIREETA